MKLDEASAFFKNLIIESDNKTEIKIYKNFISIFTDLNNRDLSEEQLKSIEEKLDSLNFNENSDNRKKHFKQKLNLFVGYLKEKLSNGYDLATLASDVRIYAEGLSNKIKEARS